MKTGITLNELAAEISRRQEMKKDFISPVSKVSMDILETQAAIAGSKPVPVPVIKLKGQNPLAINDVAHQQLSEFTKIPMDYYKRMLAEKPELLATNVNMWMDKRRDDRRMIRTLDGKVRAFLSDKYRALENEELAEAILPVLLEQDLIIMSCQVTDTRMYIKAVDRRIELDVPTGRKMGDGSHVFFDTLSPAITISNSEVGLGALSIETGIYTRVCTNLAMIGTGIRKYHTGAGADINDEVYALLSDNTKKVTDAAIWGQVRDIVGATFDKGRFAALTQRLQPAIEDRIEGDVVEVVKQVSRKFTLGEGEQKGILARLIEGGDLTRYGLHAAITRHSADVLDYDRATQLERLGGQVIELPKSDWANILKMAA